MKYFFISSNIFTFGEQNQRIYISLYIMSKNQTLGILFMLRTSRMNKKGEAPIYVRITVDGERSEIALNRFIEPTKWNAEAGHAKGTTEVVKQLNTYIDIVRNKIYDYQKELLNDNEVISSVSLKNKFLGITEKKLSLIEVIQYHNNLMKERIGIDISQATFDRYETVLRLVQQFLKEKYKDTDFTLKHLKFKFLADFEHFLKTTRKCNSNTTAKYIQNFRKIINVSIKNEWLEKDPFTAYRASIKPVERDFLTPEELAILENKEIKIPRIAIVRDIFVFCCYTGLAYADVFKLTPDNIVTGIDGEKWIYTHRTKTKTKSNIPLLPKSVELIEKYKDHPVVGNKGTLLPVLSNQKMNSYLKEIADICEINKTLTFHIARHTFATTVTLTNGVPIESVSKMLGHKNIRTTQIYAKVVESKVSNDMKALREKLSSKNQEVKNVS